MKPELINFFKETVCNLAKLSKCVSHKVGCIIVKDERIISMGYNGTPSGFKNCNDIFNETFDRHDHHKWSTVHEIHAEMNALMFASKNGIETNDAIMFCTLEPCSECIKSILQSGIKTVYFINKYDKREFGNEFDSFIKSNIKIEKI